MKSRRLRRNLNAILWLTGFVFSVAGTRPVRAAEKGSIELKPVPVLAFGGGIQTERSPLDTTSVLGRAELHVGAELYFRPDSHEDYWSEWVADAQFILANGSGPLAGRLDLIRFFDTGRRGLPTGCSVALGGGIAGSPGTVNGITYFNLGVWRRTLSLDLSFQPATHNFTAAVLVDPFHLIWGFVESIARN